MSTNVMEVPPEDEAWVKQVAFLPRARTLLDHLAAFDATIACGGANRIEPPIEQTATWRRLFCYDYFHGNAPLGITCKPSGELPKCIGILNLSGKHCVYYSDAFTLAKVVCLSSQKVQAATVSAFHAVLTKAEEINAGVLFCFCLPFQASLDRIHWDIRTIRKTARGAVKDGELCFSSTDIEAKTVPCTTSLEFWPDTIMRQLVRKLKQDATPTCLDRVDEDDVNACRTPAAMETIIEMLKSGRKNLISSHKQEMEDLKQKHALQLAKEVERAEEAEQEASVRIAKVAHASKTAEEITNKKTDQINVHNATLREQVAAQSKAALEAKALLAGQKLEREHEIKGFIARQKTLEAQVTKLRHDMAKQTAEQAKARKEVEKECEKRVAEANRTIVELRGVVQATNSASLAIQASAKRAHSERETVVRDLHAKLEQCHKHQSVLKAIVILGGLRFGQQSIDRRSDEKLLASKDIRINDTCAQIQSMQRERDAQIQSMHISLMEMECAPATRVPTDTSTTSAQLQEAEKEIGRKEHLLKEMDKRTKYLEKTLKESDSEVRKLTAMSSGRHNAKDRRNPAMVYPPEDGAQQQAHGHNTVAFMSQHHGHAVQHATPYVVDRALENTISQLYSALNCVTTMARSSNTHSKRADLTQAKLDALCSFGIPSQYYQQ